MMYKTERPKPTTHKSTNKHKSGKKPADSWSHSPPLVVKDVDLGDEVAVVTVVMGSGRRAEVGTLINARSLVFMHIWKI